MSEEREEIRKFINQGVNLLVDYPQFVKVTTFEGERTTVYNIKCHASDIGKVIGKHGQTITAMRKLLLGMSVRANFRAVVEIADDEIIVS